MRSSRAAIAALLLAAAALVVVELANGAVDAGRLAVRDPCEPRPPFPGQGIDATLQRVVLDGLDGAACELGATREELVLSLAPRSGTGSIRWDGETIERARRSPRSHRRCRAARVAERDRRRPPARDRRARPRSVADRRRSGARRPLPVSLSGRHQGDVRYRRVVSRRSIGEAADPKAGDPSRGSQS